MSPNNFGGGELICVQGVQNIPYVIFRALSNALGGSSRRGPPIPGSRGVLSRNQSNQSTQLERGVPAVYCT